MNFQDFKVGDRVVYRNTIEASVFKIVFKDDDTIEHIQLVVINDDCFANDTINVFDINNISRSIRLRPEVTQLLQGILKGGFVDEN